MRIWTWANLLTASRLVIALPCAWAIMQQQWLWAGSLFVLAVVSDLYDGVIARRRNEVSALGGLLDHATDAIFVIAGLCALSLMGVIPLLLPLLVAVSFLQYLLDSRALQGQHLRMSRLGRWNGISYFVLLGIAVFSPLLQKLWQPWPGSIIVQVIAWLLIVSTLASMADRGIALLRR